MTLHQPRPPVVLISRPQSAASTTSNPTPARPAPDHDCNKAARPVSCSPIARRRDLVPRDLRKPIQLGVPTLRTSPSVAIEIGHGAVHKSIVGNREDDTNVLAATIARKEAEEAVQKLERRIAHYRTQEERVLRSVWIARELLAEKVSSESQATTKSATIVDEINRNDIPKPRQCRAHKRPRVRDQLEFLSKQKRLLQRRKQDTARHQKEKIKSALQQQRERDQTEIQKRKLQKDRIRSEELQSQAERAAKQRQYAIEKEARRNARLAIERARELEARTRLQEMQNEERDLALRLEALKLHQLQLEPLALSKP